MRFSVSTQTFYADGINFGDTLPADAIELIADQELPIYEAVNAGCYIYMKDGTLTISEPRPDNYYSWDEDKCSWVMTAQAIEQKKQDALNVAAEEKQQLIDQANDYMNGKQWPGKAAIGRLKGEELELYGLWLDYLDALEMVDTTSAPDIDWPILPEGAAI